MFVLTYNLDDIARRRLADQLEAAHEAEARAAARVPARDPEADILVHMLMETTNSRDVHERCKRFLGVRS